MTEHPSDVRIFERRLHPHRSLSSRNFLMLMMGFSALSFAITIPFVILGAWPVAGFMGLDVLAFFWAFRANYRAARAYEDICVTPVELSVAKVSARGARREWRFNPAWVRLEREELEDYGTQRVDVVSRGRRLEVGGFLGPEARSEFADGLARAIQEARRGPRFNP
jgi:uncharacterized membrane protein